MSRLYDLLNKAQRQVAAESPEADDSCVAENQVPGGIHLSDLSRGSKSQDAAQPKGSAQEELTAVRNKIAELAVQATWSPSPESLLLSNNGSLYRPGREEFRTLRTRLNLIRDRTGLQKLLITSPLPAEGKTFVTANLAQSFLWERKHQVLLIDGDLRIPHLHAILGVQATLGLSDYLSGSVDEFAIIKRQRQSNLFFIPGGQPATNANELLGNGRLNVLLDRLAPAFDWIIFDSPPVIPLSDAKLISEPCDGVLMVVRAGSTPFDLAQVAYNEFRDKSFLRVVLNGADPHATYGDRYYDYYYGKSKPGSRRS